MSFVRMPSRPLGEPKAVGQEFEFQVFGDHIEETGIVDLDGHQGSLHGWLYRLVAFENHSAPMKIGAQSNAVDCANRDEHERS